MTCLLIDADMLLFRVMSAAEIDVCLGADQWIRMAELNEVRDKFTRTRRCMAGRV